MSVNKDDLWKGRLLLDVAIQEYILEEKRNKALDDKVMFMITAVGILLALHAALDLNLNNIFVFILSTSTFIFLFIPIYYFIMIFFSDKFSIISLSENVLKDYESDLDELTIINNYIYLITDVIKTNNIIIEAKKSLYKKGFTFFIFGTLCVIICYFLNHFTG